MERPAKPPSWPLSPPLTTAPNLWRGAIVSIPLWGLKPSTALVNETTYDLAARQFRTINTSSTRFETRATPQGVAIWGNGAAITPGAISLPGSILHGRTEFTVLSVQRPDTANSVDRTILGSWVTDNFVIAYHYDNGADIRVVLSTTGGNVDAKALNSYAANELNATALVMRTNGQVVLWINGVRYQIAAAGSTRTISTPVNTSNQIGWMGDPHSDQTNKLFGGHAHMLHILKRGITDAEAQAWTLDPWSVYRPASRAGELVATQQTAPPPVTAIHSPTIWY